MRKSITNAGGMGLKEEGYKRRTMEKRINSFARDGLQ